MATKTVLGAALLGLLAITAAACGGEDAEMAPQTPAPSATVAPEPPPPAPVVATPPPPKPSMLETQMAFAKIYGTSLDKPDQLITYFAPDAVMWNVGSSESKGRDAILAVMKGIVGEVGDFKAAFPRIWIKGNTLVLEGVTTATDKKSGKPVSVSGCEIFVFNDDGLIVTDHAYFDDVAILEQTGAYKGQHPAPKLLPLPTAPSEVHVAKNDATEDANAKSILAVNEAWLTKDDESFLGFFTDDFADYDMSENGTRADKKFMFAAVVAGRKAFQTTALKNVNVIAVEDFTIDEEEWSATQKAAYSFDKLSAPNTKKSVTVHNVEIHQWKDGKIVKKWNWENGMELDSQLGIGPAAPKRAAAAKPLAKK